MINPEKLREAAAEYSTHKKDCTCKGKHFNEDKAKGFEAGANYAASVYEEEIKRLTGMLSMATDFEIGQDKHFREITVRIKHKEKDHWAAYVGGNVINNDGNIEYEPLPSSRDDDFIKRTRCSLDEAFARAKNRLNQESNK